MVTDSMTTPSRGLPDDVPSHLLSRRRRVLHNFAEQRVERWKTNSVGSEMMKNCEPLV